MHKSKKRTASQRSPVTKSEGQKKINTCPSPTNSLDTINSPTHDSECKSVAKTCASIMEVPEFTMLSDMQIVDFDSGDNYKTPSNFADKQKEYDKISQGEAPQWFKEAFSVLANDLTEIRKNVHVLNEFGGQCKENRTEITNLKQKVSCLESANNDLKHEIVTLQIEQRKNNIMLHGIPETSPSEITTDVVYKFFVNNLDLKQAANMLITAYRLGKPPHLEPKQVKKPRSILIKFAQSPDRDTVWRVKSKLKGSNIVMSEDLPGSVLEKRKIMYPYFTAARRHPEVKRCQLKQDCLIIDGKSYNPDNLQALAHNLTNTKLSEKKINGIGTAFFRKESYLSNFYPCSFIEKNQSFLSVEMYYHYKKAMYFKDEGTANEILKAKTPNKAKALGYKVKHFDETIWHQVDTQIMFNGCAMKFQQNQDLATRLKETKGIFIEANPKDTYFSCGLAIGDPNIVDMNKWRGKNLLGDVLRKVREVL